MEDFCPLRLKPDHICIHNMSYCNWNMGLEYTVCPNFKEYRFYNSNRKYEGNDVEKNPV